MTVVLVLATLLVFVVIDLVVRRRRDERAAQVVKTAPETTRPVAYVEGFRVPEDVRYHAGHGWAMRERKQVMRVGVDEFAAALLGRIDRIDLPMPGRWVRQGQRAFAFARGEERTEVLSPVEGEVVAVNAEVLADPSLLRKEPYDRGWLLSVSVPDEETVLRNLLPQGLVRSWMRETAERLYALQPSLAGSVAADGGVAVDDLAGALAGSSWEEITARFFLI